MSESWCSKDHSGDNSWPETERSIFKLECLLTCSVCHKVLCDPHTLTSCDHTFCRSCIVNALSSRTSKCPDCGLPGWLKDLQFNRQMDNLVQLVAAMKKQISTSNEKNAVPTTSVINWHIDERRNDSSQGGNVDSHDAENCRDTSDTQTTNATFLRPQVKAELIKRRLKSSRPTPGASFIPKVTKVEDLLEMDVSTKTRSNEGADLKTCSERYTDDSIRTRNVSRALSSAGLTVQSETSRTRPHHLRPSSGNDMDRTDMEVDPSLSSAVAESSSSTKSGYVMSPLMGKAPPTVKRKKTRQMSIIPFTTTAHAHVGSVLSKDHSPTKPSVTKTVRRNIRGETPLHVAAIKGDLSAVRELLQQGADPNAKDNAGWTPLHEACNHGHLPVVKVLLTCGALVNTPGFDNDTPLHDAVANGHVDVASLLLSQGANSKLRNCHGKTPDALAVTETMAKLFRDHRCSSPTVSLSQDIVKSVHASPQLSGRASKVVLLGTGLKMYQKNQLQEVSALLGAQVVETFSQEVSHVITVCDKSGCCPRTLKFLCAVASGKWIVSFQWISKCLQEGYWINEEPYEACGVNTGDSTILLEAPKKGRKNKAQQAPGLFDGCEFYFSGDFPPPRASKEDLKYLVRLSGGTVLTREPRACDQRDFIYPFHAKHTVGLPLCNRFIVYDPCTDKVPIRNGTKNLATVPASWLLDCLSHFELVNLNF